MDCRPLQQWARERHVLVPKKFMGFDITTLKKVNLVQNGKLCKQVSGKRTQSYAATISAMVNVLIPSIEVTD
jgi:hypothetical protein